jgi:predicted DNA-binding transcriptional regulator AlpA
MTQVKYMNTPNQYTEELRKEAISQLDDNSRKVIDLKYGLILLDISRVVGYALARKGELPGAVQIGNNWKIRREELRKFLHGEE